MNSTMFYLLFLSCLLSCTDSSTTIRKKVSIKDVQNLCDGSEDLVLAIRMDSFHRLGRASAFFGENGRDYLYLNGKCQYWTWLLDFQPNRHHSRTGFLDENQALALLQQIQFEKWEDLDDTFYMGFDSGAGDFSMSTKNIFFRFSQSRILENSDEDAAMERSGLSDGFYSAIEELYENGQDVNQAQPTPKLRLYVNFLGPANENWWDNLDPGPFIGEWPLQSLESFWENKPYCFGDSILLEGEKAKKLAVLREKFIEEDSIYPEIGLVFGAMDSAGLHYEIYMRDVLPFENDIGLAALNSEFDQTFCP